MRDLVILFVHLIATVAKLLRPGGARSVVAESLLLKHQLLILNRSRARAPNLRPIDRVIAGLCTGLMRPARLLRSAIVLQPVDDHGVSPRIGEAQISTALHAAAPWKPGPKGPAPELITAIVEMKRRNPRFGCRRIAQQIAFIFGVEIDKDVVRRVLAKHYRPTPAPTARPGSLSSDTPKIALWSVDLFRCESLILKTHWVMVVMDQFTRRIIGFAVQRRCGRWSCSLPYVQPGIAGGTDSAAPPQQRS